MFIHQTFKTYPLCNIVSLLYVLLCYIFVNVFFFYKIVLINNYCHFLFDAVGHLISETNSLPGIIIIALCIGKVMGIIQNIIPINYLICV